MRRLARYDDVRAIGPLAESLEWPDESVKATARTALTRLLPQLRVSDAGLLNAKQRGCLYRCLKMPNAMRHSAFLFALLKCLEQVGDEAAVPYVTRLAKSVALTRVQKRVRQAAEECLPFLTLRAEQMRHSQILLRPAGVDGSTAAVLLRPAVGGTEADPQQLLRASHTDE
jgi:hypothetical protein